MTRFVRGALPLLMLAGCGMVPIARAATLEELVRAELRRCPAATARDLYKMLYQGAMGVEHLLSDPAGARRYLEEEMAGVSPEPGPLLQPVSPDGSVARVNLAAFKARGLDTDRLFAAMCESARTFRKRPRQLTRWWREVGRMVAAGGLDLDRREVDHFAADPDRRAVPHHSAEYEAACAPHYRVVQRAVFERFFPETTE